MKNEIRELLYNEFGLDGLDDDTAIFSANKLDSMDVLRLIVALEAKYSIKISPFSVTIDMFDTVSSIEQLLKSTV